MSKRRVRDHLTQRASVPYWMVYSLGLLGITAEILWVASRAL